MQLTVLSATDEQDLLARIRTLAADGGDGGKAAQKARSARYGIGVKDGGNVTKPSKWSSVPDGQWGDPVNKMAA